MKKVFFTLCFFIAFMLMHSGAHAQIRLGAKGGFTFASQSYKNRNDNFNPGILPGITIGGIAEYQLTDKISLASGLQYMSKGYKAKDEGDKYTLKFSYIQIPVQAQYHHEQFFGAFGFYYGKALGGKYKEESGFEAELDLGKEVSDDFSGSDFGLVIEGGYAIQPQLRGSLFLNAGLSNLIPGDAQDIYDDVIKNSVFGLAVTYLFFEK
jgi:hypothetical protein